MKKANIQYLFRRIRLPWVNRNYKDSTFKLFFNDKKAMLELYNAINETDYRDPEELIINTLDNAIFLGMVNDLSFIIDTTLNIYEHQSTKCPNMPLRALFYSSKLYSQIVDEKHLYSSTIHSIPEPHFVVFYNGIDELPETSIYTLSDMYARCSDEPDLELKVHVVNINLGKNQKLVESCKKLHGYSVYVAKIREYAATMSTADAVANAIDYCVKHDILREFFLKERKAITMVSLFEYDQAGHMELIKEESIQKGIDIRTEQMQKLFGILAKENRIEEIQKACSDAKYLEQLFEEYNIKA